VKPVSIHRSKGANMRNAVLVLMTMLVVACIPALADLMHIGGPI